MLLVIHLRRYGISPLRLRQKSMPIWRRPLDSPYIICQSGIGTARKTPNIVLPTHQETSPRRGDVMKCGFFKSAGLLVEIEAALP